MTKQHNNTPEHSDKLCSECRQPLLKIKWSKNGEITLLVCDNIACNRDHQPQGTEILRDFEEFGEIGVKTP